MLLVDEVDKTDVEVEGLLLEVLSDFQVTIPELGTVTAVRRPFVVLTSNASRELSEAVKRRCLFLHLDYPDAERERAIVVCQVPRLDDEVAAPARRRRRPAARARAQEGAVDRGVRRLGAHPGGAGGRRPRRGHRRRAPSAWSSSTRPTTTGRSGSCGWRADDDAACSTRHIALRRGAARRGPAGVAGRGPRRVARARARCDWATARPCAPPYAATLVKRQTQRPTLRRGLRPVLPAADRRRVAGRRSATTARRRATVARRRPRQLGELPRGAGRRRWPRATEPAAAGLAVEAVARFGAMPGRGRACRAGRRTTRCSGSRPHELVDRLVRGAAGRGPRRRARPARTAGRRVGAFTRLVEADARRRIAEEKGPDHVARRHRPADASTGSTSPPRAAGDLEEMRREIYPLARRLAARLTRSSTPAGAAPWTSAAPCARRSSTGGVPLTTHHRPKRPHRTDLVVLCDVSGSVANFAQFTLMLVFALREQFSGVRAFTFVDDVAEVTDSFRPGADVVEVMAELAGAAPRTRRCGGAPTTAGRSPVRRGAPRRRSGRGRRCWCWATRAPTTATSRCRVLRDLAGRGPARVVAQPRAPAPLGHRRQRGRPLRRDRPDGGVPQPRPARRVRARHRLTRSTAGASAGEEAEVLHAGDLGAQLRVGGGCRRHGRR